MAERFLFLTLVLFFPVSFVCKLEDLVSSVILVLSFLPPVVFFRKRTKFRLAPGSYRLKVFIFTADIKY
jgi:hypothetical protein